MLNDIKILLGVVIGMGGIFIIAQLFYKVSNL